MNLGTRRCASVAVGMVACAAGGALWALDAEPSRAAAAKGFSSKYVDDKGGISLPDDYRLAWTHLGSWSVEDAGGAARDVHNVYAQPDAVASFRASGKWPDGAVIVKEVRGTRAATLTTGKGAWDAEIKQWFVMVKDSKNTFPENPNWGRGWGWALFDDLKNPKKNTSTNYKLDCLNCHVPAQDTDWVYQHGYAVLNEKDGPLKPYPAGTYEPAGRKP